jgi:prepilin-type N-terminal cleavage/methylation domain-containing protein
MKPSPRTSSQAAGFTLVELLVTMAILSVILTMAFQVTESSRKAIRLSESRSSNDAIAREVFDRINRDISQMIVRKDARLELNSINNNRNDNFAFFTLNKGINSGGAVGTRNVSLVRYQILNTTIVRGSNGHSTGANTLNLISTLQHPNTPGGSLHTLSNNVLRMEVEYLVENPAATPPTITKTVTAPAHGAKGNLRGLIITIATADVKALSAIKTANHTTVANSFVDATATANTQDVWSARRNSLAIPGVPPDALKSIRIYQRTFLLP